MFRHKILKLRRKISINSERIFAILLMHSHLKCQATLKIFNDPFIQIYRVQQDHLNILLTLLGQGKVVSLDNHLLKITTMLNWTKIIKQLEFHDSTLTFVSDLKYSIVKLYQDKIQLVQSNIETKEDFSKVLLIDKELLRDYKDLIKREAKLSNTIERFFKVLIQRRGCNSIFRSNKIRPSRYQCFNPLSQFLQSKLMKCCSYRYKKTIDFGDKSKMTPSDNKLSGQQHQHYEINSKTYELYLSDLNRFLVQDNYDVSLYNYLKNVLYKWVLGNYKQQVKNQLNLLGSSQNFSMELLKTNKMTKKEEQDKILQKQKLKVKQSVDALLMESKLPINKKSNEQTNCEKQDSLFIQLHDQQFKINIHSSIHAPLVNVAGLQKIYCANFFYDFSAIEVSKYNAHPQLTANIIILRNEKRKQAEKLKDNANQNSQNSHANQKARIQPPVSTTPPPHPVSQAVCALLNNQGGYILIGLQKNKEFYQIASESTHQNLLMESQYCEIIKKSFPKCWNDEKFRSIIKISYIPIVQRSRPRTGKQNLWQLQQPKQIKFICRIKVQPKDEYQRMFYFIGGQKNEKGSVEGKSSAYDIVKSDLNIRQLTGQEIYKKMKQIQTQFGTFNISGKKAMYKSLNKNQLKITSHLEQKCKNVEQRFSNLILPYVARINTSSCQASSAMQTNTTDRSRVEQNKEQNKLMMKQQAQQQKQQFKSVNIIVLENKQLKSLVEQMFKEKKFSVKIQKLETTLKKLSKTTYITHHNKKFEEINSQLNEFKKLGTNSKKALLISAEKSVFFEKLLDSEQLESIDKMFKQEKKSALEKLEYVEDVKENKSYLKAESKLGGIYLYFIATQMDLRSRMKNVPQNLINTLIEISEAIQKKKGQQEKHQQASSNYPQVSSKSYKRGNADSQINKQSQGYLNGNKNSNNRNQYNEFKPSSQFNNKTYSNNTENVDNGFSNMRNYSNNFRNTQNYSNNPNYSYYNQYQQTSSMNSSALSYGNDWNAYNNNMNGVSNSFNHNQLYFQTYGQCPPYNVIYNYNTGMWQYVGQSYQQYTTQPQNYGQSNQASNNQQYDQNNQNHQHNPQQQQQSSIIINNKQQARRQQ